MENGNSLLDNKFCELHDVSMFDQRVKEATD